MEVSKFNLIQLLPTPEFKKVRIKANQTANDIIAEIKEAEKLYRSQYKQIASNFKSETVRETAKKVWNFLKTNVTYKIEGDSWQTSKSPAVLLHQGYGDCKHYSLFTMGVLRALGIECIFRFTSYRFMDSTPQHVYVIVKDENGNWFPVDAVWTKFGEEKEFTHKKDIEPMSLYRISGIDGGDEVGKLRVAKKLVKIKKSQLPALKRKLLAKKRKLSNMPTLSGLNEGDEIGKIKLGKALKKVGKGLKKATKATGKGLKKATKATGKGLKNASKFAGKTLVKVALTPARNAFLALVGLNFKGLGWKMNKAMVLDRAKVETFWVKKFKGKMSALENSIKRGAKKGKKYTPGKIGAVVAFMTAAAPILVAVMALLQSVLGKKEAEEGGNPADGASEDLLKDDAIQAQIKAQTDTGYTPPYMPQSGTDLETMTNVVSQSDGETVADSNNIAQSTQSEIEPEAEKDNSKLLVGGLLLGAAVYLASNK